MRFIGLLIELVLIVAICYGAYRLVTATRRILTAARNLPAVAGPAAWKVRHYGEAGHRVGAVSLVDDRGKVLDEHVVDRIPDSEPDWEARFLRARQTAEERAFHLGSGSDPH